MNAQERDLKGRDAAQLLENELLQEAFDLLDQAYVQAWHDTKYNQQMERDQLWHRRKALEAVKLELAKMVEDGYLARISLEKPGIFSRR